MSFPYAGPEALRQPVTAALSRVIDPEVSLNIVEVGLVYGVTVEADTVRVRITMTSAACPVIDLIIEDAELELSKVMPEHFKICTELVWEPPWTPERLSEDAKRFMGW
jgi:metal-sulfur cluster biosynthetic enzyme